MIVLNLKCVCVSSTLYHLCSIIQCTLLTKENRLIWNKSKWKGIQSVESPTIRCDMKLKTLLGETTLHESSHSVISNEMPSSWRWMCKVRWQWCVWHPLLCHLYNLGTHIHCSSFNIKILLGDIHTVVEILKSDNSYRWLFHQLGSLIWFEVKRPLDILTFYWHKAWQTFLNYATSYYSRTLI